jgi:choline dehydrogenase-like flavoprotein
MSQDCPEYDFIIVGAGPSALGFIRGLIEPYCTPESPEPGRLPFTIAVLEQGTNGSPSYARQYPDTISTLSNSPTVQTEKSTTNVSKCKQDPLSVRHTRKWYEAAFVARDTANRYTGLFVDQKSQTTREIAVACGHGWGGTARINAGLCFPPAADDFDTWWEKSAHKTDVISAEAMFASVRHIQSILCKTQHLNYFHSPQTDAWADSLGIPVSKTKQNESSAGSQNDQVSGSVSFPEPFTAFPSVISYIPVMAQKVKDEWHRNHYYSALIEPLVQDYPQVAQYLHFYSSCAVERLLWDDFQDSKQTNNTNLDENPNNAKIHRVIGVQVKHSDSVTMTWKARKEVAVCAGAIESPALLLVSGVGGGACDPRPDLDHLPVGQHLHDHVLVPMHALRHHMTLTNFNYASLSPNSMQAFINLQVTPTNRIQLSVMDEASTAFIIPSVVLNSIPRTQSDSGWRRSLEDHALSLLYFFVNWMFVPLFRRISSIFVMSIGIFMLNPVSTGSITILPNQSTNEPCKRSHCKLKILLPYFSNDEDVKQAQQALVAAHKVCSAFCTSLLPNMIINDLTMLRQLLMTLCQPYFHYQGTCRMKVAMQGDLDWVVDEECKVQNCDGLRVCDASVFPTNVSAPTTLTCVSMGHMLASHLHHQYATAVE